MRVPMHRFVERRFQACANGALADKEGYRK